MIFKNKIKPKEENFNKCLNYVFFLLNRREYSQKEIKDKLEKYLYHENDIAKVLSYIQEHNYQSDERFASTYVKNKSHKYGKKKLEFELMRKGIDKEIIQTVLEENLENNAKDILMKKFGDKERDQKTKQKIIRFMLSRGFNYNEFKDYL